jgi:hypothetical protein
VLKVQNGILRAGGSKRSKCGMWASIHDLQK